MDYARTLGERRRMLNLLKRRVLSEHRPRTNSAMRPARLPAAYSLDQFHHASHEEDHAALHVADYVHERMVRMEDAWWRHGAVNIAFLVGSSTESVGDLTA
jgi:hypothetical protein